MRARIRLLALVVGALPVGVWPGWAAATDCTGLISPCVNDDGLWPHAGPARFQALGSTETVARGQLGFGIVASYLSRPIIIRLPSPGDSSDQSAVESQLNTTFLWAFGVSDAFEIDLVLPLTFAQSGAGLSPITGGAPLADAAVRDMRFGFTYVLVPRVRVDPVVSARGPSRQPGNGAGLATRFEVSAPTGDRDQFAGERSAVFVPTLTADYRRGRWFAAAEGGARIRPTTELLGTRVGTQIVAGLGVGFDILADGLLSATVEAWALPTIAAQDRLEFVDRSLASIPSGRTLVPAEWAVSALTAPLRGGDLTLQLGGGGGLPISGKGELTPLFRMTFSLRWAPSAANTP